MSTQYTPAGIDAAQAREAMEYARTWRTTAMNVTKQRDDLLAALIDLDSCRNLPDSKRQAVLVRVRVAIANARGSLEHATEVQS